MHWGTTCTERRLGLRRDDCYAIGDSENDLDMFSAVGTGIAMGRCAPALLERCAWQTSPPEEDGIYRALEHFGLL